MTELGLKIFYDRYSVKDQSKDVSRLKDGDPIIWVDPAGQTQLMRFSGLCEEKGKIFIREYTSGAIVPRLVDISECSFPTETPDQAYSRVAGALAKDQKEREAFYYQMQQQKLVPAGRILAGMGNDLGNLTSQNCYVLPSPADSREGIMKTATDMINLMASGGGVGINLSSLRPKGNTVLGVNGRSSGAVSWGELYSFLTGLVEQGGSRRGAGMLCLSVWHPDVIEFIAHKQDPKRTNNANISILITDDFMTAVRNDSDWKLEFPDTAYADYDSEWKGDLADWKSKGYRVKLHKTLKARELFHTIAESAWKSAEPGLLFIDQANRLTPLNNGEKLIGSNPCGEQLLPGNGACCLSHINLAKFVNYSAWDGTFSPGAGYSPFNWTGLKESVQLAIRFLDAVVDKSHYPLPQMKEQQIKDRRLGLGILGLGEVLVRLGYRYGSDEAVEFTEHLMGFIRIEAYKTSHDLWKESPVGECPEFREENYLRKNITLLSIAPTGTVGTMLDTTTGIEPYFAWQHIRKGRLGTHTETAKIVSEYREKHPDGPLPAYFVTAQDITGAEHVAMMSAAQKYVCNAISKTVNLPSSATISDIEDIYLQAYTSGCKGCAVYRDNSRVEQVLNHIQPEEKVNSQNTDSDDKAHNEQFKQNQSWTDKLNLDVELLPEKTRKYPGTRDSVTVSMRTAGGNVHTTLCYDDDGCYTDLFVNIGKSGSDVQALVEAIGRLCSDSFRAHTGTRATAERIIHQLEGIRAQEHGMGLKKTESIPDAIAKSLRKAMDKVDKNTQNSVIAECTMEAARPGQFTVANTRTYVVNDGVFSYYPPGVITSGMTISSVSSADLCPGCGQHSVIRADGCKKCQSCDWSKC